MKRIIITSLTLSVLGVLAACGGTEREIEGYNETNYELIEQGEWEDYGYEGNVDAYDGRMQGNIGNLSGINGDANVQGYAEDEYADLQVVTVSANGSAMHILTFSGGLNHEALSPGAHLEFTGYEGENTNSNGFHVMSMNCSGPGQPDDWDYDEPADRVEMDVSETDDPEVIRVDYTTEVRSYDFGSDSDTSSGSFYLRR